MKIPEYYREHDDFRRYLVSDRRRVNALRKLYSSNKKYFGKRVLDLACGGGILASVLGPSNQAYVGIDVNPDMIRAAKASRSLGRVFILGDVRKRSVDGSYDTLTLLGNALIHFDTEDLRSVLANVKVNAAPHANFILDYRDVVSSLFRGTWKKNGEYVEHRRGKEVVSVSKSLDSRTGTIRVESRSPGRPNLEFAAAVWSPFILQSIMESNSWRLVRRKSFPETDTWLDIYQRDW